MGECPLHPGWFFFDSGYGASHPVEGQKKPDGKPVWCEKDNQRVQDALGDSRMVEYEPQRSCPEHDEPFYVGRYGPFHMVEGEVDEKNGGPKRCYMKTVLGQSIVTMVEGMYPGAAQTPRELAWGYVITNFPDMEKAGSASKLDPEQIAEVYDSVYARWMDDSDGGDEPPTTTEQTGEQGTLGGGENGDGTGEDR